MVKVDEVVLKWQCPFCGKVIVSLYREQLNALREQHLMFCKKKV